MFLIQNEVSIPMFECQMSDSSASGRFQRPNNSKYSRLLRDKNLLWSAKAG